jgi:hypothetical protein
VSARCARHGSAGTVGTVGTMIRGSYMRPPLPVCPPSRDSCAEGWRVRPEGCVQAQSGGLFRGWNAVVRNKMSGKRDRRHAPMRGLPGTLSADRDDGV